MPTLRRLGVPFAIMTGHEPGSPQLAAGEGMPVLSKPFGEAELRAILLEPVGEAGR